MTKQKKSPLTDLARIEKAFRLFNEKADTLQGLSFLEKLSHPDAGASLSWTKTGEDSGILRQERRGPEDEARDAFVNTFRFFIQDNEPSSFRNMAKHYQKAPIDKSLKSRFAIIRNELNEFLKAASPFTTETTALSNGELMRVCVYGGISHSDAAKEELHKMWMSLPVAPFFQNHFMLVMALVFHAISGVTAINTEALESWPTTP